METVAPRIIPQLTDVNRPFWTGGENGELLVLRCSGCDRWVHPPVAACPACGGGLTPAPVSGRGTVFAFTVNEYAFNPAVPPPYVIAIVELEESDDLRVPTNIVGCDVESVYCSMPVQVRFEQHGDVFVPLFEPWSE